MRHHTSEIKEKRTCASCGRTVGVHNWSKRLSRHFCPHIRENGKRWMCDSGRCDVCANLRASVAASIESR